MVIATRQPAASSISNGIGDLAEHIRPSIVAVRDGRRGSGSGVVWKPDIVITNHHVVHGDHASLVFADGREATGQVIGRDPHNDIVALRVDVEMDAAAIGDSTALRIGQIVLAIGHPLGIEHAVTVGIVSGLPTRADPRAMIRSDLHLHPGNSGGALLAADGRVVGVNAMVAGPGTALSVPEHTIRAFLARLGGEAPVLGLELSPVQIPLAWASHAEVGLLVTGMAPGSLAESAGLYPGDILLAVSGHPVQHPLRVREELADTGPDRPLILRLIRAGEPVEITIHLDA